MLLPYLVFDLTAGLCLTGRGPCLLPLSVFASGLGAQEVVRELGQESKVLFFGGMGRVAWDRSHHFSESLLLEAVGGHIPAEACGKK